MKNYERDYKKKSRCRNKSSEKVFNRQRNYHRPETIGEQV